MKEEASFGLSRREILKLGAGAAAGAGALAALGNLPAAAATTAAPISTSRSRHACARCGSATACRSR